MSKNKRPDVAHWVVVALAAAGIAAAGAITGQIMYQPSEARRALLDDRERLERKIENPEGALRPEEALRALAPPAAAAPSQPVTSTIAPCPAASVDDAYYRALAESRTFPRTEHVER